MKKKIIKILTDLGFTDINYEYGREGMDWHNYAIRCRNKNGGDFHWVGRTENFVDNSSEIMLNDLTNKALANCI